MEPHEITYMERAPGDMLIGPAHMDNVEPNFGRVVATQNREILLRLSLHFHAESTWIHKL